MRRVPRGVVQAAKGDRYVTLPTRGKQWTVGTPHDAKFVCIVIRVLEDGLIHLATTKHRYDYTKPTAMTSPSGQPYEETPCGFATQLGAKFTRAKGPPTCIECLAAWLVRPASRLVTT